MDKKEKYNRRIQTINRIKEVLKEETQKVINEDPDLYQELLHIEFLLKDMENIFSREFKL